MRLYKAFATVGGMTLISRALGFIRDILVAFVLGTGPIADAFFVAFRFPNLFRRLFGEGAFNAAFIPLFAKELEGDGKQSAKNFANQVASVLITALLITTALAELTMPWLIYFIAPGFNENPEKLDLAIFLTRITFPYLACMSLVALLSGMLNALDKFAAAAAVPILLNIILIAAMSIAALLELNQTATAGIILSWGVAIAGFAQLFLLLFCVTRQDFALKLKRPRLTPQVKKFLWLSIPGILAGGITQINIMIGTIIASMQESAVSFLYYADRLYQLPLGIVGIAIGVVLLPELSRKLRANEMEAVHNAQNRSLEFSALLTMPAAVALFTIPEPIIKVLFERGAFDANATMETSAALAAFAIGLPSFVLIKVFSPGFFAREDTKTPMIFAGISMIINVSLSLLLFTQYKHVGIAIATSVAGWANAILLGTLLYKRGHFIIDRALVSKLPRIILSSLIMGLVLYYAAQYASPYLSLDNGIWIKFLTLFALVSCGVLAYGLSAEITGATSLKSLKQSLRPNRQ
ncbi:MAG: murein biosynthesis integral membrane protein MurJ [Hyphomicrobiales bacterium]